MTQIKVGIADYAVCNKPDSIITIGLGSCVGVCIYDKTKKIAGMVHVMLPEASNAKKITNEAKYADTGIELLVNEMRAKGALKSRLVAKIAGGAQMFSMKDSNSIMRIGERNVEAVKNILAKKSIKIIAEDVGANYGRTIEFFSETGDLNVKSIKRGQKVI